MGSMPRHNSTALQPTMTTSIAHKALAAVEPVSPKTPQELEKMLMQRLKSYMQGLGVSRPAGNKLHGPQLHTTGVSLFN